MEHLCEEVRPIVATCLGEIIRIKASITPYDDSTLKRTLQLIVDCLCGIHDIKGPTFGEKVKIL